MFIYYILMANIIQQQLNILHQVVIFQSLFIQVIFLLMIMTLIILEILSLLALIYTPNILILQKLFFVVKE